MKSFDIRSGFLNYFNSQGHKIIPSSSLIPYGDDTLLFSNAGMNQFKGVFLGQEDIGTKRAVSSQKCVRAGGKHNDLENVGHTARHHTFFEMLGNFSFGDYFKKEAIHFAWDFLTNHLGIDKNKLYITVFETDDEAAEIWKNQEKVPSERISRFGEADNFWRMGDTGPCGPCSEVFYDHGPEAGCKSSSCKVGCSCDRYVEIWNLVFMQFFEDESGVQTPLPKPSIDTGAGLERLAAVLQNTPNNYNTDLFTYLIEKASKISGIDPMSSKDHLTAMRVLSDHARAAAFLIGDGVIPSAEGRGYVLRRIIRRGIRYGRKLSDSKSFLPPMVESVIDYMGAAYPELRNQKELVINTTQKEEERFVANLDRGSEIFNAELSKLQKKGESKIPGEVTFMLYDTYGFPPDLTKIMALERNFKVDIEEFESEMEKAKILSRSSWKGKNISSSETHLIEFCKDVPPTQFLGYDQLISESKVLKISNGNEIIDTLESGHEGLIIFDRTPFYAESGGQVGDTGEFFGEGRKGVIGDCQKLGDVFYHFVKVTDGKLSTDDKLNVQVTRSERRMTAANHSATHLLHSALREVLGKHVSQAGSLVDAERLRFDFTNDGPLSPSQISKVEEIVNSQIISGIDVLASEKSYDEAIKSGAMALFGEKYGDQVRVIQMGNFSTELCGGTHVISTSEILAFKIVNETGVSSGVRRIEALTGANAIKYLFNLSNEAQRARRIAGVSSSWSEVLSQSESPLTSWIESKKTEIKDLEKELKAVQSDSIDIDQIVNKSLDFGKGKFVMEKLDIDGREILAEIADKVRNKLSEGIVILVGYANDTHPIIATVSKSLSKEIKAGDLLKKAAAVMNGKGGGRHDFAQGAVSDLNKFDAAKTELLDQIKN